MHNNLQITPNRQERIKAVNGSLNSINNFYLSQTNNYHIYYNKSAEPQLTLNEKPPEQNNREQNKDAIFNYFNGVKEEFKKMEKKKHCLNFKECSRKKSTRKKNQSNLKAILLEKQLEQLKKDKNKWEIERQMHNQKIKDGERKLNEKIQSLQNEKQKQNDKIVQYDQIIMKLTSQKQELEKNARNEIKNIEEKYVLQLQQKSNENNKLINQIKRIKEEIFEKQTILLQKQAILQNRQKTFSQKEKQTLFNFNQNIKQKEEQFTEKMKILSNKQEKIKEKAAEIEKMEKQMNEKLKKENYFKKQFQKLFQQYQKQKLQYQTILSEANNKINHLQSFLDEIKSNYEKLKQSNVQQEEKFHKIYEEIQNQCKLKGFIEKFDQFLEQLSKDIQLKQQVEKIEYYKTTTMENLNFDEFLERKIKKWIQNCDLLVNKNNKKLQQSIKAKQTKINSLQSQLSKFNSKPIEDYSQNIKSQGKIKSNLNQPQNLIECIQQKDRTIQQLAHCIQIVKEIVDNLRKKVEESDENLKIVEENYVSILQIFHIDYIEMDKEIVHLQLLDNIKEFTNKIQTRQKEFSEVIGKLQKKMIKSEEKYHSSERIRNQLQLLIHQANQKIIKNEIKKNQSRFEQAQERKQD